ncbi:MAG: hypothetical protein ACPH6D_04850, partial [Candidatus Puniceispirillales bacterium]
MGTGEASGEGRATNAAEAAIHNPLLDETTLKGAQALLINITGGSDMTLFEADEAANHIRKEVDNDAIIIFGAIVDPKMEGVMRVSVVATGMEAESQSARPPSFQQTSAVASASRITHQDSQQPFYATKRNEGVIEKIIPETTSVFPAEAEQTVPSILAKAQASHLADSHAMDMTPEAITEPAPEAKEIPEAVAEAASDIGNDTRTGDHQQSIMDFVDEEPKPSETETEAKAELAPLASASSEGADDEVPFTLGRTVDIATEELSETKEATGLMRHITRLFSSHQQQEKKAESPVISDVEPFTLPKAEPMFRSGDETDTHAVATSPSEQADQKELNTKTDELSDQHDQISLTNNTRAPELDMKDQKDEFDLEIPAFLRRQAN